MIPCFIFLWILPVWGTSSVDEAIAFDIVRNEKVLGKLKATKSTSGHQTVYESQTTISTRIIKKIEMQYESCVKFKNGRLEEAEVVATINGRPHSNVLTKRVDNTYQFHKNGKLGKTISGSISCSAIMMLFDEPRGISTAWSEDGGCFCTIVPTGHCTYQKVNSKGHTNKYFYKNQDLQSIAIDAGLVGFDMILKSQN
jgi:uncharacterized protein DUF6134